jgi:uncharacterized protein YlxW (UPF0749 family)
MAAEHDTRRRDGMTTDPSDEGTTRRERRTPRPVADPPPQAVMGLLNYITATSLDEDYAHVSKRRATSAAPRKSRPGAVGLVVIALFGTLVATAAVQTSRNADETASSRRSLVAQVTARRAELASQRATVTKLNRSIAALQDSNLAATTSGRAVRSRVNELGVTAGGVPTTGPGVKVVVDDAPNATTDQQQVLDKDLQKLVNALWLVGAEGVSINDQRITNLTAIRQAGSAITANFVSLRRPYVVRAIGNKNQMAAKLLDTDGGRTWSTLRSTFGLKFDIDSEDSMTLPPADLSDLRYARQPERRK